MAPSAKTSQQFWTEPGRETEASSLSTLSRTLEDLEARLALLSPQRRARQDAALAPAAASVRHDPSAALRERGGALGASASPLTMTPRQPAYPEDMTALPRGAEAARERPQPAAEAERQEALDRRFRELARELQELTATGSGYSVVASVSEELQRLRAELSGELSQRFEPNFRAMREMLADLREMIGSRESAQVISQEIHRVSETLERLAQDGAEGSTLAALRSELTEMRDLLARTAREESLDVVGRRWDEIEHRLADQAQRSSEADHDIKRELVRLRDSLQSLASEDQVRAVEQRWAEFETRYLDGEPAGGGEGLSRMLTGEFEMLRGKLEELAGHQARLVADERWGALGDKFASKDIEASIRELSGRMEQIEASLVRLPEALPLAQLEERIHALALGIDALAREQPQVADDEQLGIIDDRLDEISRAIVALSLQAPAFDMAPIERIEARIAALTARVDKITDEGELDTVSQRVAVLASRFEALADAPGAEELTQRLQAFTDRLEGFIGENEAGVQPDVAAIEARLSALAARLEAAVSPQVDSSIVEALEAQIARLSQQLGGMPVAGPQDIDPEFEQRLIAIEQKLDESRDGMLASARAAADEAVARMLEHGDRRESEHVARLSDDLRALERLARETDDRANDVFEAVHSTLLKIVERLDLIEDELGAQARVEFEAAAAEDEALERARVEMPAYAGRDAGPAEAAGLDLLERPETVKDGQGPSVRALGLEQVEAPSLDVADILDLNEANQPLEPGSGAPNVAALLERVRAERQGEPQPAGKADFIAAARRAALAAAAEAQSLRTDPQEPETGSGRSLSERLSHRRKPILMAVGAVLLALMALPMGRAFLSPSPKEGTADLGTVSGEDTSTPQMPASADIPSLTAAEAPEADAPAAVADLPAPPSVPTTAADQAAPAGADAGEPAEDAPQPAATAPAAVPPAAAAAPAAASDPAAPDGPTLGEATSRLPASVGDTLPAVPEGFANAELASAATSGDPRAMFEIGLRLLEGRGGEPRPQDALLWFAQSAKRSFAPAQYSLGAQFEKGNGVARDTGAARDWYLLAARQGNVRAMHNLAVLYATGVEGVSDPKSAAQWFERAADYGMRDSQYNLGILYARGAGVDQNLRQSFKWFAIVAKAGDTDAAEKRDEIAKSLTPSVQKSLTAEVDAWQALPRVDQANSVEVPAAWEDKPDPTETGSVDMKRAIRNIQAILIKLGYDAGTPDGVVGTKTTTAIRAFQKDTGMASTGTIDEPLIRALLQRKDG
ncbi:peptidoglycan-binding protein [Aurantimonas sp. MSK8Z-1]|uniref:peptidoglycan-binding protein n=1 Tax=Mangrovibrevibacter kandeliae TaxID=2968473 RepID=UPI0021181E39|nr:peptidoglycan-binding protein [Aurantimonas sp. MSK8Z-1]MCW4116967.1 peptidoglycan-binding protein [Aurantimonas sp. MSK8Z-1]